MMGTKEDLLFQALELLGKDWENNRLPQEILLDDGTVSLLLTTRQLVADPNSDITADTLRERCPTFVDQLQQATMRSLEEQARHGPEERPDL